MTASASGQKRSVKLLVCATNSASTQTRGASTERESCKTNVQINERAQARVRKYTAPTQTPTIRHAGADKMSLLPRIFASVDWRGGCAFAYKGAQDWKQILVTAKNFIKVLFTLWLRNIVITALSYFNSIGCRTNRPVIQPQMQGWAGGKKGISTAV